MSGPIDETFTEQQLKPGTVFEFGCTPAHFTARLAKNPNLDITAVDLYLPETLEGFKFIHGDFMEQHIDEKFDNVCCVSSFEHAGIERYEFDKGELKLDYHNAVAGKLVSLVKPGGRLIVTCPFGPDEVWVSDGKGTDSQDLDFPDAKWGFRTFTLGTLRDVFSPLQLIRASAFELMDGDSYMNLESWRRVNPERDHGRFVNDHVNYGVLCVVLENIE